MRPEQKVEYTCKFCRRRGTEDIFETIKYSTKTGKCNTCAEALDLNPMAFTEPTPRDNYDEKVDASKELS